MKGTTDKTSQVGVVPPPDWWNYHAKGCGKTHRGCAPDCPKDIYERTGRWVGPGKDLLLDSHNELECVVRAWFLDTLHEYTEEALAMDRTWGIETHDEITDLLYAVYLVSPATEGGNYARHRASFKNPRFRSVYTLCLRRRLNLTPTATEIGDCQKVLPDMTGYLHAMFKGRTKDFKTLEERRRQAEERTNQWLTGRIRR